MQIIDSLKLKDQQSPAITQAFIDAVGTLTTAEETAITNLVDGLKANNLWNKLDAIYPVIGGTASAHKFNLKDPRDTDDAFRLSFFTEGTGSITHDAQGMKTNTVDVNNGAGIYTHYLTIPHMAAATATPYNLSLAQYNNNDQSLEAYPLIFSGLWTGTGYGSPRIILFSDGIETSNVGDARFRIGSSNATASQYSADGKGFFVGASDGTLSKLYHNGTSIVQSSPTTVETVAAVRGFAINGLANVAPPTVGSDFNGTLYGTSRVAFFSIGNEDLTDNDVANFNTVIEAYQVELGRSADDAQNFITAVGTLTTAEETAIINLVDGLKTNGTWDKYHAIYPFVGGTAAEHKWNLKDPRDLDAAFRMSWNGTITHDFMGVKSDGSTGYANTHFNPTTEASSNADFSMSVYKTGIEAGGSSKSYLGEYSNAGSEFTLIGWIGGGAKEGGVIAGLGTADYVPSAQSQQEGFLAVTVNGDRDAQYYTNGIATGAINTQAGAFGNRDMWFMRANWGDGASSDYTDVSVFTFASIGKGLSATNIANDYAVIEAYQRELGRSALTNGLIAAYDFEQTGGTFTDLTGNGKDLTGVNITTQGGTNGNAAYLDGETAYIYRANDKDFTQMLGLTVVIDYYPTRVGEGGVSNIIGQFFAEGGDHLWHIGQRSNNTVRGRVNSTGFDVNTIENLTLNTWHRIILRWADGEAPEIKFNSNPFTVGGTIRSGMFDTDLEFNIGMNTSYSGESIRQIQGRVDNVFIWDRRLTDAEVTELLTGNPTYSELTGN